MGVINRSGLITLGGTAQSWLAAKDTRKGYRIRNNHATDSLFLRSGGSAADTTKNSFELKAGEYFETPIAMQPVEAVSIIGATTNQEWFGEEW